MEALSGRAVAGLAAEDIAAKRPDVVSHVSGNSASASNPSAMMPPSTPASTSTSCTAICEETSSPGPADQGGDGGNLAAFRPCSLDSLTVSFHTRRPVIQFDPYWLATAPTTSSDGRSSHDSHGCDSSNCSVCHRRSFGGVLGRSTSLLSLGKRPTSSAMTSSKSASDLMSYREAFRDEASSSSESQAESMDDEEDYDSTADELKRSRRFSSHWLRQCDRASSSQGWGSTLESKMDQASGPVRAQFSEVCSLLSGKEGSRGARSASGDVVQEMKLNCQGNLLACATRAREVCIYDVANAICDSESTVQEAVITHRMPARVCSLSWSPTDPNVLSMGDADGVLWQMDVSTGHILTEVDEFRGEKLWSVSHNPWQPSMVAVSSGKGHITLWDTSNTDSPLGTITLPRAMPVCSLEFSPFAENMLAMACADHNVYVYDIRNLAEPQAILRGHSRPVSYVHFMSCCRLVSSSIDGTALLWEGIDSSAPTVAQSFRDHKNGKNFVGLSVSTSNLIACGSEDGSAYAYFPAWSQRVALTERPGYDALTVCVQWLDTEKIDTPLQECPPILAVADTRGSLKLYALIRKRGVLLDTMDA